MAIEAPYSKYKKTNFKIVILLCVVGGVIFAYDGYLSKYEWSHRRGFYDKHVKDGKLDDTMIFNQKAPFFLVAIAVVAAFGLFRVKNNRLIADESELTINDKQKIPYGSIQKIDKTNFDSKGFFVITYKDQSNNEVECKISDKTYDNLKPILEQLVAKIS